MLSMSNTINIKISSFIDPHEFYFRFNDEKSKEVYDIIKRKIHDVQRKIERLHSYKSKLQDIRIGEIYGCFHSSWGKWIRGRVIERTRKGDYKIFAIDHGYYKFVEDFIDIPQELKVPFYDYIHRGSLPLNNPSNSAWSDRAHAICRSLHERREYVTFHFIPIYNEGDINVGDLFVIDGNEKFSASEKLISIGCATKCTNPNEIFKSLIGKQLSEINELCKHPKTRIELYHDSSNMPKQLFIHGQNYQKPWKNLDQCRSTQRTNANASMTPSQSFIWPQVFGHQHVIAIKGNEHELTSDYLVPLVGKMETIRAKSDPPSPGPVVIIFASSASKVKEIEIQIRRLSKDLKIIKATGLCEEKKFELLSGCDLLLTTPPSFMRFVSDISVEIINSRLKHVVFDNFHQLTLKFDPHLNKILKNFNKLSQQPQFIVTSDSLTNALKCKLTNQLPEAETVLCVDDNHIDLACYAGMKFSIEFIPKSADIFQAVSRDTTLHDKKTIILTVDDQICRLLTNQLTANGVKCIKFNNDIIKAAQQWDENSDGCILIISDGMLENPNLCIRSPQHLIHFDLPSSWTQFSRRFQVFHNAISEKLSTGAGSITTNIFVRDDNTDEFIRLLEFLYSQNLSNSFKDILERVQISREQIKRKQHASLCSTLLQNGKCEKLLSCPFRHRLNESDKPLSHLQLSRSQIKFDLISVQNPTSFIIKITEHFDNNKWISRDETNKLIQQRLNEMQNSCQEKKNSFALGEAVVGGIYAKFDEKFGTWARGRVIERVSNQIVKVYLLDFGTIVPSIETKLQKLPENFFKMDPLVCKLQIIDLVPLDKETAYEDSHTEKLREMIRRIPKSSFFMCKVETALHDTIFTKSFDCRSKFNLKDAHQKMKISEVNESASRNLFNMISISFDQDRKPVEEFKEIQPSVRKQEITLKEETATTQISWKRLVCGKTYSIKVVHYISPHSFFVVQENENNLTLKSRLEVIENTRVDDHLMHFEPGMVCFFKADKMYRSLILTVMENQLEILLVDHGEITKTYKESLYKIAPEHLSLHFQTVHCSLRGVRPKFKMEFFPKMQCNEFAKLLKERLLEILVVSGNEKGAPNFAQYGMCCYQVLLYDNSSNRLDKMAVTRRILDEDASVDDLTFEFESENALNLEETNLVDDSENHHSVHLGKDLENILDLKALERFNSVNTASSSSNSSIVLERSESSSSSSYQPHQQIATTALKHMYKQVHIEWRQNQFMIYMLINAPDCQEYSLKIAENSFEIIVKYAQEKFERSLINLFGVLCVDLCSHELNGSNIVVRLAKKNLSIWPRLTDDNEKSQHIKFSNDKVPIFQSSSLSHSEKLKIPHESDDNDDSGRPAGVSDFEDSSESDKEFSLSSDGEI